MAEKNRPLRVAIAAGGTAGHVNPALALAEELRDRGHEVEFYGQTRRLEGTLVPKAGFPFNPIEVSGFDRERPWTLATALLSIDRAQRRIGRMWEAAGPGGAPDVAVGFGAYVELPLLGAARRAGVPTVLHEQNSVPGLANKRSARHAAAICISVPQVEQVFEPLKGPGTRVVLTGNPVRRQILDGDRARGREELGVPDDGVLLLVFGGSLGARHLNEAMARLKGRVLADPRVRVLHSAGAAGYDEAARALALTPEESQRYRLVPYIDGMGDVLAAADLVLSRSGASSVAEIAAAAAPAVLVPYPHATADHQTTNARFLTDAGAAVLVPDAELDGEPFDGELLGLLSDEGRRERMRGSARGLGGARAAARLADAVEEARAAAPRA